jgi:hypothetical protein
MKFTLSLNRILFGFLITMLGHPMILHAVNNLEGDWVMISEKSSDIDIYGTLSISISSDEQGRLLIERQFGKRRSYKDSWLLTTDGKETKEVVTDRVFPTNVFMGLSMAVGEEQILSASWEKKDEVLVIEESFPLMGSQGSVAFRTSHRLELSLEGALLTYSVHRPTRDEPISYVMKRKGAREAWVMKLENDWQIDGMLPEQAFLIALQGLANREAPNLYFVYPEQWDFRFTEPVQDYYEDTHYYGFTELKTAKEALSTFKEKVKGYVVWDTKVRTSLIVAFTVAGLEDAVVVSEEMIPMVEEAGLSRVEDFRGKFDDWSDVKIYQWAYDQYWERCSKDYIVWMGGEHGSLMKPGVADFGIYHRAFFNDLSTKEGDIEERALAGRLFSEMNHLGICLGWHSYKKDKERDHVSLASNHGIRVEGLHTLPNMSFSTQIEITPGFKFVNNHNVVEGETIDPEEKVYIAAIQTDCLGLGAWTRPGRGQIPYAWEVTMNWFWMAPAMMEFFYREATPNDYFIGSLSGPGYMYPKAIPAELRPELFEKARELMSELDLNAFEIMDYSEGATVEGNTELTKEVVDAYYQAMPEAIGFMNGYAPAFTFTSKEGRPLISFDYYLSQGRPEEEAAADLRELARINQTRPYFLLIHVRQWSDITRVIDIFDQLSPEFEVVPLDVFLKMAGEEPTFKERFLEK